jgi:hypothetical protein
MSGPRFSSYALIAMPSASFLIMPRAPPHLPRSGAAIAVLPAERLEIYAIWLGRIKPVFSVAVNRRYKRDARTAVRFIFDGVRSMLD